MGKMMQWLTACLIITSILLRTLPTISAQNYFINVTDADFYSFWVNTTETLGNQLLDDTVYYNGTKTYSNSSAVAAAIATPTGSSQTHDVTIFIQGADFITFWAHEETAQHKIRYSVTPFLTGNIDQDGLWTALVLINPYAVLGPYDEIITMTHLRMGLFFGGFTGVFAPLAYIAGKRPNGGVVIKLCVVMLFGFALLLSIVDTV